MDVLPGSAVLIRLSRRDRAVRVRSGPVGLGERTWRSLMLLFHCQHGIVIDEPSGSRRDRGVAYGTTGGHSAVSDRRL